MPGTFLAPRNIVRDNELVDFEFGGNDINDGSDGMRVKVWRGDLVGDDIVLSAAGVTDYVAATDTLIEEFSFCFDRSMRPHVAYRRGATCYWKWYDTVAGDYAILQLPSGTDDPRCCLDDNRDGQTTSSDVVLAYRRTTHLYFRAQRERYETEHLLASDLPANGWLDQIGMNNRGRFQFVVKTPVPIIGATGSLREIYDDEATWELFIGSKLHMREVVCAPNKGTERKPCSPVPLKPNCDRVK